MKKLLENNLPCMVCSLLLAVALLSASVNTFETEGFSLLHGLLCVSFILLLTLFNSMKLRGRLLALLSVFVCLLVTIFIIKPTNIMVFANSYYEWLQGTPAAIEMWNRLYLFFQILLVVALCFFFQLFAEKILMLRLSAAVAVLIWMLVDLFTNRSLPHLAVICMLCYIAISLVALVQKYWRKQKSNPGRPYMVWILPFLLLYLLCMGLMPAPDEPYDWQIVKDAYRFIKEEFTILTHNWNMQGKEDFDTTMTGFSEDGKLLGSLLQDDQEIMQLQGNKSLKTNVYLVGKVYDTFLGNQWLQTNVEETHDRQLDALETIYAVWMYDEENEPDYIHTTHLDMNYQYFHTGFLFAPLKTWSVMTSGIPYHDQGGNLLFDETKGYGTSYDLHFFQLNINHPLFYEFLEAEHTTDRETWSRLQREYIQSYENRYALEALEAHREAIHKKYGASVTVSPKIREYLNSITENADTDIEKLKAIETALSSLTYTKTPGALPESITSPEAFLDYFLLESKQGFCSYFATAFVLLARAEGIPARYVEGFCVPVDGTQLTTVYAHMAHAWPEVYIDGVGWIPFEPTPGYEEIRYTPWEKREHNTAYGVESTYEPEEDFAEEDEVTESQSEQEETSRAETDAPSHIFRIIGYTLLFAAALTLILLAVDRYVKKLRYEKWSPEEKFLAEVQRNLQILSLLGYPLAQTETLEELQKRAWAIMDVNGTNLQFIILYEMVLYAKRPVTEEMLELVCKERAYLLEELKKWKRFVYVWYSLKNIL